MATTLSPDLDDPSARDWLALQTHWAWHPQQVWAALDALRGRSRPRAPGAGRAAAESRGCGAAAEALVRHGVSLLVRTSSAYPAGLLRLADPPPALFVRGEVEALHAPMVAFVGGAGGQRERSLERASARARARAAGRGDRLGPRARHRRGGPRGRARSAGAHRRGAGLRSGPGLSCVPSRARAPDRPQRRGAHRAAAGHGLRAGPIFRCATG